MECCHQKNLELAVERNEEPELENLNEEIPSLLPEEARVVPIFGEINNDLAKDVIGHLFMVNSFVDDLSEDEKEIKLILSTEGGMIHEMLSIFDVVRMLQEKCEVETYGIGKVMSAGIALLACGTKGKRKIGKHCRLMMHPVFGGSYGETHNLETDLKELKWAESQYVNALEEHTNMSRRKILALVRKKSETYFDAQQAVDWGIADIIV